MCLPGSKDCFGFDISTVAKISTMMELVCCCNLFLILEMRGMMAKIPGYLSAGIFIRIFMVIGSACGIFAVFTAHDQRFFFWDTNIKPYCGVVFGLVIAYNVFFKIYYLCKMRLLILEEERIAKEQA